MLGVLFWAAAGTAVAALVVALVSPRARTTALYVAAAGCYVAGVLGILSIGVLVLLVGALCTVAAARRSAAPR